MIRVCDSVISCEKEKHNDDQFTLLIRESGHRATPGRISLLRALAKASSPLAIHEIIAALGGTINQATVYRALLSLVDSGVVRRIDMQHAHAHYEIITGKKHHHHLICKKCGVLEDIDSCAVKNLNSTILKNSRMFTSVDNHALEFFGVCRNCK